MHGYPFGLVPPPDEEVATYVSPEVAELGRIEAERKERGELTDEDGSYNSLVTLDDRRPSAQLKHYAQRMIPGSRGLFDLSETVDLYRQSQSMFGKSRTQDLMILIIAYGGTMLLSWIVKSQAGGSIPNDAVQVPLTVIGL